MEQLTAMYKLSLIQHMVIKNALRAPAFTESVVNVELFHFKTITVTGGVVPHVFFFFIITEIIFIRPKTSAELIKTVCSSGPVTCGTFTKRPELVIDLFLIGIIHKV